MRKIKDIPLIFTSLLLISLFLNPIFSQTDSQNQWESAIQEFESQDKINFPDSLDVLFVGSSSIRLWSTLTENFNAVKVLNRGFGGSCVADLVQYANRIILPYHPEKIVIYSGDNDINSGKAPEQVLQDFKDLVIIIQDSLPSTRVAFISIKPSFARWEKVVQMRLANQLIQEFMLTDQRLTFIDIFNPMLGADGLPRPELFMEDGLHINETGYNLWTELVMPLVMQK
jgi:lysophospholipase L1-like esterase